MKIREVADLAGISVRSLRYYDNIGLLHPDRVSEAGYRLYSQENIDTLQQILFYKALGFPLKEIKRILLSPDFDRLEALYAHREALIKQRKQYDRMLQTVEETIKEMKGENVMTNKEKFEGFDFSHHPYEEEARERWGNKTIDRSTQAIKEMSNEQIEKLQEEMNQLYQELADVRHLDPASVEAQAGIEKWYDFLCNGPFGTEYTLEAFKNLGIMYVEDERFTKNIDQFGEGLAAFMKEAMAIFANKHQEKPDE